VCRQRPPFSQRLLCSDRFFAGLVPRGCTPSCARSPKRGGRPGRDRNCRDEDGPGGRAPHARRLRLRRGGGARRGGRGRRVLVALEACTRGRQAAFRYAHIPRGNEVSQGLFAGEGYRLARDLACRATRSSGAGADRLWRPRRSRTGCGRQRNRAMGQGSSPSKCEPAPEPGPLSGPLLCKPARHRHGVATIGSGEERVEGRAAPPANPGGLRRLPTSSSGHTLSFAHSWRSTRATTGRRGSCATSWRHGTRS
jgi:hypothetical protein